MFNEYLNKIGSTDDLKALKNLAHTIYNDKEISELQKKTLLQTYKTKIKTLYDEKIKNSENKVFVSLYFLLKKYSGPEVGRLIHAVQDKLDPIEKDILFTEYDKAKFNSKPKTEKKEVEVTEEETEKKEIEVEPF